MTREEFETYLGKIREEDLMDTAWQIEKHDAEQRAEIARLREALQTLIDVQNGPPLEKYRVEWEQVMNNAESLLKETL